MRTILVLAFACSGCFAINDTDRFAPDEGCDLQLRLRNFNPHTDDLFSVRLVQEGPSGGDLLATAVFEPLESQTLNLRMPNGVPPLSSADRQLARLEFFGDDDSVPGYSFPGDHSWILEDACTSGPEVFPHDIDFQEVSEPTSTPTPVVVSLCDVMRGAPIEVRVYADLPVSGGAEVRRATGLYRFVRNPRDDVTVALQLPAIVDRGFEHFIDVYIDANANGAYDDGEPAWMFTFAPDPDTPDCDLNGVLPGGMPDPCADVMLPIAFPRFPACVDGDVVRVTLGPISDNNRLRPGESLRNLNDTGPNSWLNFDPDDDGSGE